MRDFCDSCNEQAERFFDITRLPEFAQTVRTFNYRQVCQNCYDDLLEEIKDSNLKNKEERRNSIRYSAQVQIHIEGTDREGHFFNEEVFTEDISRTGIKLTTNQDVEVGSVLKLVIAKANFEATTIVELVWKQPSGRSIGLKIIEQNAEWEEIFQSYIPA